MDDLLKIGLNLPLFGLVLCRIGGLVLAAPILSSMTIPLRVRAAVTALLGLIMLPIAAHAPVALPDSVLGYLPIVLQEMGLGLLMGFSAAMLIASLEAAGGLAAQQIGVALAQVASPDTHRQEHVISVFLGIIGLLLFLAADGHHWLIRALASSYRQVPLGMAVWRSEFSELLREGLSGFTLVALRIAAPLMGIMFMLTVLIALIARTVPQMNILLVGYPVKVFVGVMSLVLTFPLMWPVLRAAFQNLQAQLTYLAAGGG